MRSWLFLPYIAYTCNQSAEDWNYSYKVWFSFSQGRWKRWEERHPDRKQRTPGGLMEQARPWVTPAGRLAGHDEGNSIPARSPCAEWDQSRPKWSGIERGDERCPDRSCGTYLPACTRINLLTLNDWRTSEGPWGPARILWRPFGKTAWILVLQKRSSCGSEKGKSLRANEEGKKTGCGWVTGQGNYFKSGGQSLCVKLHVWRHAREKFWGVIWYARMLLS